MFLCVVFFKPLFRVSHKNKPCCEGFKSSLQFKGYKLSFNYKSRTWHGAPATIIECPGDHLWGCVWMLHKKDLKNLDE